MTNYNRDEFSKIYKTLPTELQTWIVSGETDDNIYKILETNGLVGKNGSEVSDLIRDVLFGLLPPERFKPSLIKEVELESDLAEKISHEINRFIFFPVKELLEKLYAPVGSASASATGSLAEKSETPPEPPAPKAPDAYRESIE